MKTRFPHRSGSIGRLLLSGAACALLGLVLQPTPAFPAAIPGTLVASKITSGNTLDTFSIGDTAEMGGTPKQVADVAARDAITTERRTEGMTCWVIDESNEYRLVGGIANANWTLYSSITNVVTGSQFVTNDGSYLHLWGTVTNQSAPWALSNDGELFIGTNALAGNLAPGFHTFGSVSYANSNQVPTQFFDMLSADYTGLHSYGLINGAAGYSPASATWTLRSGDNTGSTNSLAQQAHSGSAWVTASVDGTNRAQLSYLGVWEAQGFKDDSGTPGMIVGYGAGGLLVPTNVASFSNVYSTNIYVWTNSVGDLTVTNGITNLSLTAKTVLAADTGRQIVSIPNGAGSLTNDGTGNFGWGASLYLTNLTVNNIVDMETNVTFVTNVVFNKPVNFNTNVYMYGLISTNGVTNLTLTANTVIKADANRAEASIPNGTGALTNDNAGVFGWYNNYLDKSGGTVTGPILSTSATTNTPGATELATAGWVRGLFNAGTFLYTTTNIFINATNVGSAQPMYEFSTNIPQPAVRSWTTADFLTNGAYIGSVLVTNPLQQLSGQIAVTTYLGFTGGSSAPTLTLHPEIYYSYDRTNWFGDYSAGNQNIIYGQTNMYQWVIDFPAHTSTNATGFWIQRRFKVGTVTGIGTRTLWVLIGTNSISGASDASHISIQTPSSSGTTLPANATGALTNDGAGVLGWYPSMATQPGNNVFSGSNHFSGTITTSTNLSWGPDFAVEETCLSTNAAFTFAAPVGVDTAGKTVQWTLVNVTNTTAVAVLITSPANCHTVGTPYVTNWTAVWFQIYAQKITNAFYIPVF